MKHNKPFVDRSGEMNAEPIIKVVLPCGFTVDFWQIGLTDKEYISRTIEIKKLETR